MRPFWSILPLATLLIAAAPADPVLEDAQCLLALGQLASVEDEEARQAGQMGSQYFFGRLDGRAVGDLEALLKRAAETITPETLEPTLQRCAAVMHDRGQALQTIGERMNAAPPPQ
jgi:hypothetical protein